jgi:hypothetical protein
MDRTGETGETGETGVTQAFDALDAALLALVQAAPQGSQAQLSLAAEHALVLALRSAATTTPGSAIAEPGELVGLACAMERCLELIGEGLVDPGLALPALAMAAHTARSSFRPAIAAARYEIETLLPIPGQASAPRRSLDVPAQSLVRRPSLNRGADATTGAPSADAAAVSPIVPTAAISPQRVEQLFAAIVAGAAGAASPDSARAMVAAARQRLRST